VSWVMGQGFKGVDSMPERLRVWGLGSQYMDMDIIHVIFTLQ
jgi:hypothetical protein